MNNGALRERRLRIDESEDRGWEDNVSIFSKETLYTIVTFLLHSYNRIHTLRVYSDVFTVIRLDINCYISSTLLYYYLTHTVCIYSDWIYIVTFIQKVNNRQFIFLLKRTCHLTGHSNHWRPLVSDAILTSGAPADSELSLKWQATAEICKR